MKYHFNLKNNSKSIKTKCSEFLKHLKVFIQNKQFSKTDMNSQNAPVMPYRYF